MSRSNVYLLWLQLSHYGLKPEDWKVELRAAPSGHHSLTFKSKSAPSLKMVGDYEFQGGDPTLETLTLIDF